jgi:hypothetical protein
MRRAAAALVLLLPLTAQAATSNETACILKAAETLPKIAGMQIGKSRVQEMPSPAGWQWGPPIKVEVDWTAAGVASTWAYLCTVGDSGNAVVQRLSE